MVMSFLPGEGLKVVESGFSGVGCEQQTYFRLSLLSLRSAISGVAFFVSNTYFHCTKNLIYTKCFPLGGHCDIRHFTTFTYLVELVTRIEAEKTKTMMELLKRNQKITCNEL